MSQQEYERMQTIFRELQTNFHHFLNGFTGQGQFTIHNAIDQVLLCVLGWWRGRRTFTSTNCLTLILTQPLVDINFLKKIVEKTPSVKIIADGEVFHVPGYMNLVDDYYYEGNAKSMCIFNTKTADQYNGQVKSLEEVIPHGFGSQSKGGAERMNGPVFSGNFVNGNRQGYGQEQKGNVVYKGNWKDNEKNGVGLELVFKKKKKNKNPSSATSQVGSTVKSQQKEGSESESQNTLAIQQGKDTENKLEQIQQKQQQNHEQPVKVQEKKEQTDSPDTNKKEDQQEQKDDKQEKQKIQYEDIVQAEGDGEGEGDVEGEDEDEQGSTDLSKLSDSHLQGYLKFCKSVYLGKWENGMKEDQNGKEFSKHNKYVGGWSQGVKTGFGKMQYKVGSVYEGQWKNNLLEGEGKYTDQAGNVYTGSFEGGEYHGQGTIQYVNGDKYEGQWKFGKKEGQGVYTFQDGDYYDGAWIKDKAEGKGSSMTDGNFFEGQFSKGMRHGLGEETLESGDTEVAIWKNNDKVKVVSINGQTIEEQQ